MPKVNTVDIRDYVTSDGAGLTVDRDARVIRNVMASGNSSTNRGGIDYAAALNDAVPMYDNKPILMRHRKDLSDEIDLESVIGVTRNARRVPQGVMVDIEGAPGPMFDMLMFAAEKTPSRFGMSQEGRARLRPSSNSKGGPKYIAEAFESIDALAVTSNPASTRSLYDKEIKPMNLAELREQYPELVTQLLKESASALSDSVTQKTKAEADLAEANRKVADLTAQLEEHTRRERFAAAVKAAGVTALPAVISDAIQKLPEDKWSLALTEIKDAVKPSPVYPGPVNGGHSAPPVVTEDAKKKLVTMFGGR